MRKEDLFICYSNNLKNKLNEEKVEYVIHGYNKEKNKDFWVFIRDDKCKRILDNWKLGVYKK